MNHACTTDELHIHANIHVPKVPSWCIITHEFPPTLILLRPQGNNCIIDMQNPVTHCTKKISFHFYARIHKNHKYSTQ